MEVTRSKLASLVIAAVYFIVSMGLFGAGGGLACLLLLLFPLVLIWFPDELGSYTGGGGRGHNIDMESPEWAVAGLGWIFLIGGPVVGFWLASRS